VVYGQALAAEADTVKIAKAPSISKPRRMAVSFG
jgi:hypothetical protein